MSSGHLVPTPPETPRKVSHPIVAGASPLAPPCPGGVAPDDAPHAASSAAPGAAASADTAARARRRLKVPNCACVLDMLSAPPRRGRVPCAWAQTQEAPR